MLERQRWEETEREWRFVWKLMCYFGGKGNEGMKLNKVMSKGIGAKRDL